MDDLSGEVGKDPEGYASTYLWIDNTPNDLSELCVEVYYDPDILGVSDISCRELEDRGGYLELVPSIYGPKHYTVYWHAGEVIPAGTNNLELCWIRFGVGQNIETVVSLDALGNHCSTMDDAEGWSIRNAVFNPTAPPLPNNPPELVSLELVDCYGVQFTVIDDGTGLSGPCHVEPTKSMIKMVLPEDPASYECNAGHPAIHTVEQVICQGTHLIDIDGDQYTYWVPVLGASASGEWIIDTIWLTDDKGNRTIHYCDDLEAMGFSVTCTEN